MKRCVLLLLLVLMLCPRAAFAEDADAVEISKLEAELGRVNQELTELREKLPGLAKMVAENERMATAVKKLDAVVVTLRRGKAAFDRRQYAEAARIYTAQLQTAPDAVLYNNRAVVLQAQHEYPLALRDYDRAIAMDRSAALFFYNRATLYERLGQHGRAGADFARARKLDPKIK